MEEKFIALQSLPRVKGACWVPPCLVTGCTEIVPHSSSDLLDNLVPMTPEGQRLGFIMTL